MLGKWDLDFSWTFSLRRGAGPLDISYLLCLMHYDLRFLGEIPDVTVQPVFGGALYGTGAGMGW